MAPRLLSCLIALLLIGLAPLEASAQTGKTSRPFSVVVTEWNRTLEQAKGYLGGPSQSKMQTEEFLALLSDLRKAAAAARADAEAQITSVERLTEALGPTPEGEEQQEPPEVAEKRKKYSEDLTFYRARQAQAQLAIAQAQELETTLAATTRQRLVEKLLRRNPVTPTVIGTGFRDVVQVLQTLARAPFAWRDGLTETEREKLSFTLVIVVVVLAALIGWGIRRFLLARFGRDSSIAEPSYRQRLLAAIAEGVARGIVPALIFGGILARLGSNEARITGLFADLIGGFCLAVIVVVLAVALPKAALAPDLPAWRLAPIGSQNARTICRLIVILAAFFAADMFLALATASLDRTVEAATFYALVSGTLEGIGILLLVRHRLWQEEPAEPAVAGEPVAEPEPPSPFWRALRVLIMVLSVAGIGAALLGYSQLSFYLIKNLLISGVVVGALFLLRGLLRELVGGLSRSDWLVQGLRMSHRSRQLFKFWLRAFLDLAVVLIGIFVIAPGWGMPVEEMTRWTVEMLQGFQVGSVTISVVDIALAVAVFLLAMVLTRMLQRALSDRILPQTQLDTGVQHSLASGFGYVGLVLAAALAIATVGIDLSNIALIAGALSVGIGFGLQNIVNNFVSGLILLVERPIKVGDWVVVGNNEGFVKRINVRATELQTFQRASVIIPNADLLSAALTNLTHKDRYGRIEVIVGVAYGSDTAKVRDILLECAGEHERVLGWPEPFVLFRDFGASSLDFELRCYTDDVVYRMIIGSDLRFRIDQRFREDGIEIPFPQRVLHMAETKSVAERPTGVVTPMPERPAQGPIAAGGDES